MAVPAPLPWAAVAAVCMFLQLLGAAAQPSIDLPRVCAFPEAGNDCSFAGASCVGAGDCCSGACNGGLCTIGSSNPTCAAQPVNLRRNCPCDPDGDVGQCSGDLECATNGRNIGSCQFPYAYRVIYTSPNRVLVSTLTEPSSTTLISDPTAPFTACDRRTELLTFSTAELPNEDAVFAVIEDFDPETDECPGGAGAEVDLRVIVWGVAVGSDECSDASTECAVGTDYGESVFVTTGAELPCADSVAPPPAPIPPPAMTPPPVATPPPAVDSPPVAAPPPTMMSPPVATPSPDMEPPPVATSPLPAGQPSGVTPTPIPTPPPVAGPPPPPAPLPMSTPLPAAAPPPAEPPSGVPPFIRVITSPAEDRQDPTSFEFSDCGRPEQACCIAVLRFVALAVCFGDSVCDEDSQYPQCLDTAACEGAADPETVGETCTTVF